MGARATIAIAVAALAGVAVLSTQDAAATRVAPACREGQLRLVTPQTQGTASQQVVFVGLRNSGVACRLSATASFGLWAVLLGLSPVLAVSFLTGS